MIREWCEICEGSGMLFSAPLVGELECKLCQGKGWVALEPNIIQISDEFNSLNILFKDNIKGKKFDVYVKESK